MIFLELVQPPGVALCPRCGRLFRRIRNQLGAIEERISLSRRFIEDLGADSLDLVELVMEFEEEFGIAIPDDEAKEIRTIGNALAVIESLAPARDEATPSDSK